MDNLKNIYADKLDKRGQVSYEMLREMAKTKGLKKIRVNVVQIPNTYNGMHAIADAEIEIDDGVFQEIGDATHNNTKEADESGLLRMAILRAKVRALKEALGINASISEEEMNAEIEEYEDFFDVPQMDSRELVITFGKYKNFSLGEILEEDLDYVEWLALNSQDMIVKNAAKEVINTIYDEASNLHLSKH